MKFWKRLKQLIDETLPEMRDKFLAYKDLKKLVRLISSSREASDSTNAGVVSSESGRNTSGLTNGNRVSAEEADFICLLNSEIDKINAFFVEQEEDFVIREKELQERIRSVISTLGPTGSRPYEAEYKDEMGKIRKEIVNFHGEMVLLENYSNLNYTGLAKILKKYDKRTGRLLRLPFIEKVLQQPFFTTDLLSKLVKQCEITMEMVFQMDEEFGERGERGEREAATSAAEESIFRNTVAALATMRELRKGSSTYSHFSLPPLNLPDPTLIQAFQLNSPIPIL